MLRHYCGEYLVSPVGVHLGLNFCSHNCYYCFANLNQPRRRADFGETMRVLRKAASDEPSRNVAVNLLRQGQRILVSNDSDPFAVSNSDAFQQIHDFARERGFLFAFQTRGGKDARRILEAHPPTWVYVSMTSDMPERIKLAEPGAPDPESRWELASAAVAAGHHVVVGLNPFRPGWWKDPERLVRRFKEAGVAQTWVGDLHLSRFQIPNIPPKQRERHAEEIDYAKLKNKPDHDTAVAIGEMLMAEGVNLFEVNRSEFGDFWGPYERMAGVSMPTLDSLMVRLGAESREAGGKPVVFSFDWFDAWADVLPGVEASAFKEYLQPFGRTLRNMGEDARARSFRDVHEQLWRVADLPTALGDDQLGLAVAGPEDDAPVLTDDLGRPLMVYTDWRLPSGVRAVAEDGSDGAVWLTDPDEEAEDDSAPS